MPVTFNKHIYKINFDPNYGIKIIAVEHAEIEYEKHSIPLAKGSWRKKKRMSKIARYKE